MNRVIAALIVFLVVGTWGSKAQSRSGEVYASASMGVMSAGNENGFSIQTDVGCFVSNKLQVNLLMNQTFKKNNNFMQQGFVVTAPSMLWREIECRPSFGVGFKWNFDRNTVHLTVPVKLTVGYMLTSKLSLNLDTATFFAFRRGETTSYAGLGLGYRF